MNSLIDGFHHSFPKVMNFTIPSVNSFQMTKMPFSYHHHLRPPATTTATGHRSPPPPPPPATTPLTTTVVQHKRVFWSFVIIPFQFFYKPNKQIPIHLTDYISFLSTKHLAKLDNIPFQFLLDSIPLADSIPSEIILRTKRPSSRIRKYSNCYENKKP